MLRRTKIVTTLGPATDRDNNLEKIILAGANMVRMNFSHGSAADHIKRAEQVRAIAKKHNKHVAILGDLQGPKIRVSKFIEDKIQLNLGDRFCLDAGFDKTAGTQERVSIDYPDLAKDVCQGDILLLDDGRVQLKVIEIKGQEIHTEVTVAGPLSNNKGINKQGGGLSADALTDKDKADIITAAEIDVDFIAVSFPRSGSDINYARELVVAAGSNAKICAKVERAETVVTEETMKEIILASDAIMVARGDLGVEIGDAALVAVQKSLIHLSRKYNRVVITATQMMESMIHNSMPTRAEVMDVANAVLDGTDAVMLSAETAAGAYPVETVTAMADVCLGAETHPSIKVSNHRIDYTFSSIEETIAMSTMYAANHLTGVKAIVALTESGTTPLLMSRISSGLPIFSLSPHQKTLNATALYRGVTPLLFNTEGLSQEQTVQGAIAVLKQTGHFDEGDIVLLTLGDKMETVGSTNTTKIVTIK